jgi:hypothetical protein
MAAIKGIFICQETPHGVRPESGQEVISVPSRASAAESRDLLNFGLTDPSTPAGLELL